MQSNAQIGEGKWFIICSDNTKSSQISGSLFSQYERVAQFCLEEMQMTGTMSRSYQCELQLSVRLLPQGGIK
jgi:hypothetical protein